MEMDAAAAAAAAEAAAAAATAAAAAQVAPHTHEVPVLVPHGDDDCGCVGCCGKNDVKINIEFEVNVEDEGAGEVTVG